jgi:hypothetical protein
MDNCILGNDLYLLSVTIKYDISKKHCVTKPLIGRMPGGGRGVLIAQLLSNHISQSVI